MSHSHHALRLEPGIASCGPSVFRVGCHCLATSGKRNCKSLNPDNTFLFAQKGHVVLFRVRLSIGAIHSWPHSPSHHTLLLDFALTVSTSISLRGCHCATKWSGKNATTTLPFEGSFTPQKLLYHIPSDKEKPRPLRRENGAFPALKTTRQYHPSTQHTQHSSQDRHQ